jgi:hypothetical protein
MRRRRDAKLPRPRTQPVSLLPVPFQARYSVRNDIPATVEDIVCWLLAVCRIATRAFGPGVSGGYGHGSPVAAAQAPKCQGRRVEVYG